jgi:hypothetical protein
MDWSFIESRDKERHTLIGRIKTYQHINSDRVKVAVDDALKRHIKYDI